MMQFKAILRRAALTAGFFLAFFSLGNFPPSLAAEKDPLIPSAEKLIKSDAPLNIASDRMDINQKERLIVFEGHVVAQQDDLTLTAQRMKVFTAAEKQEKKAGGKGQEGKEKGVSSPPSMMERIERIEVEGEVRISQQDKLATADKAVYYHGERKIVLLGNPIVTQGKDRVQGKLITLYLAQGRSVVEGGGDGPVKAILHPSQKE